MTITYEYEGALYVNLTNRCNCNCEFCLRHGKKEGSIYTEDSLWLEREPTRQEALDSFLSRDVCSYREIVFCPEPGRVLLPGDRLLRLRRAHLPHR